MWYPLTLRRSVTILLLCLGLSGGGTVSANPNNYPEFAQHTIDPAMPITFVKVENVKKRLDAGSPTMLVDVRSAEEYAQVHLPHAVSIPLGVLSVRLTEIPRDIPVVLY